MTVLSKGLKISQVIANKYPELKGSYTIEIGVAEGAKYPNGQSVADVAYWNEYGTTKIPARPFITPTFLKYSAEWGNQFEWILEQSGFKLQASLEAFANMIVGQVKNEINNVWEPPLALSTLKFRELLFANTTGKPLIVTGMLFNSITYQIEKK